MGKVLAEHPDQRQELAEDRSLLPTGIEELHGQTVPAGSALLLMLASANRDERRFDEPDRSTFTERRAGT